MSVITLWTNRQFKEVTMIGWCHIQFSVFWRVGVVYEQPTRGQPDVDNGRLAQSADVQGPWTSVQLARVRRAVLLYARVTNESRQEMWGLVKDLHRRAATLGPDVVHAPPIVSATLVVYADRVFAARCLVGCLAVTRNNSYSRRTSERTNELLATRSLDNTCNFAQWQKQTVTLSIQISSIIF